MPYGSKYMTFWKTQNYGDSEKISGCGGVREGVQRDEKAEHRFLEQ